MCNSYISGDAGGKTGKPMTLGTPRWSPIQVLIRPTELNFGDQTRAVFFFLLNVYDDIATKIFSDYFMRSSYKKYMFLVHLISCLKDVIGYCDNIVTKRLHNISHYSIRTCFWCILFHAK